MRRIAEVPERAAGTPRTVYLEDLGCQMNRMDSELVLGRLSGAGFTRADRPEAADVILFYTCSVREHAEDKVWTYLGQLRPLKRRRPSTVIGVMGCMAQNHRERIFERAPHVDLVCGTSRFEDILDLLAEVEHGQRVIATDEKDLTYARDISLRPRKAQAFVTIMRGCDKFCTFCIVPYTQGRERSREPDDIEAEVRRLVGDGVCEVVLLGQRVNTWGLDLPEPRTLASLLRRLHGIPGLARIQFITSHPTHITDELIGTIADHERISRYLHLPVQSGSDRILRAMNRGHTVAAYERIVDRLRAAVPDISLATDWIVGFPGEEEEDFRETVALLERVEFQSSFVFKYSTRTGTRAARLEDTVPEAVRERRNHELLDRQMRISERLNASRIGRETTILIEGPSKSDPSRLTGRTAENRIVHVRAPEDLAGRIVRVRLVSATALSFQAELV